MYLVMRSSAILSLRETGLGDGLSFLSAPLNFVLEACFTLALGLLQALKKIFTSHPPTFSLPPQLAHPGGTSGKGSPLPLCAQGLRGLGRRVCAVWEERGPT